MPFTAICPGCNASLTAPDEVAEKRIKCTECGERFIAKAASQPNADDNSAPDRRLTKAPAAGRHGFSVTMIAILSAVCLLAVGGAVYFFFIRKVPETLSVSGGLPPRPPLQDSTPKWNEYKETDGHFRVKFPYTPKREATGKGPNKDGTVVTLEDQAGHGQFKCMYRSLAAAQRMGMSDEEIADSFLEMLIAGSSVPKDVPKKSITHQSFKGREFIFKNQKRREWIRARVIVAGDRIIGQLVSAASPGGGEPAGAKTFFDSMTID